MGSASDNSQSKPHHFPYYQSLLNKKPPHNGAALLCGYFCRRCWYFFAFWVMERDRCHRVMRQE